MFLAKITYGFSGLGKIKLLKYKMINFNKMLIVQRNKRFCVVAVYTSPVPGVYSRHRADTATTSTAFARLNVRTA